MVKFQFLATFPVDHLFRTVVSCFIVLLHKFTSFTYYVRDVFVSTTSLSISTILLHLILALFWAATRRVSVSRLIFPFLNNVQVFFVWDTACSSLEMSIEMSFYPFLFSVIFLLLMIVFSALFLVTTFVFLRQFFFVLIVKSMHRCYQECWQIANISYQFSVVACHWNLIDCKSQQDFSKYSSKLRGAGVWIVSVIFFSFILRTTLPRF